MRRGHAREVGIARGGGERRIGVSGEFGPMGGLESGEVAGVAEVGGDEEWRVGES